MKIVINIPETDKGKWINAYKSEFNYDKFKSLVKKPPAPQDFMEQKILEIVTNIYRKYQVNAGKKLSINVANEIISKVTVEIIDNG